MISYSGVVGHTSKVTLPSVSSWGTNMNILRDPPKGIQTRKIDKVGETSSITQMIQESGDRACEAIMTYARGVNPMVSVSYDNYGNSGGISALHTKKQAFLPYRIMDKGAFRPPARDQRELLPLSRLPRLATSCFSQPGFADFSKKAMCPGLPDETRGVKKSDQILKACIRPTAVFTIETPIVETYEVKNIIKNPIKVSGDSGVKSNAQFNLRISDPTREIIENPLHVDATANLGGQIQKNGEINIIPENYTHEVLHKEAYANPSRDIQVSMIDELYGSENDVKTKDVMHIPYMSNKISTKAQEYLNTNVELSRKIPEHEAHTNKRQNIYHNIIADPIQEREYKENRPMASASTNLGARAIQKIDNISNRDYTLKPTINAGEYNPNVGRPQVFHPNQIIEFDQSKMGMRQKIYEMQQARSQIYEPQEYV